MGDDVNDDPVPRSLPDDVLQDDVLRRLPQCTLAVCRCVCKAWRDAIDLRGMLRPEDLLPPGIFLYPPFGPEELPLLFAPRCMGCRLAATLESFVDMARRSQFPWIRDCCNGLLFLMDQVVNPATRKWAAMPGCPAADEDDYSVYHLLFGPRVSPHFDIIGIQELDAVSTQTVEEGSEWPPSPCIVWVYSSATGRWEERAFEREARGPAGAVAEAKSADYIVCRRAVYYHGVLYVHCKGDFIMWYPSITWSIIYIPLR